MTGFADPGADRTPFTLLGGYLGAGKTTLLNRLLTASGREGRRVVALVNDLGSIGADAALVVDHDGPTLTLANGCVCCAVTDDLVGALEVVRSLSPRPDHVVMELSGVGEPARLARWANTPGFRLDGIVVVADAEQVLETASRRYVGDTVRSQIASGDVVVLTKTDIALDVDGVRRMVTGMTEAPVLDAAVIDPVVLFGVGGTGPAVTSAGMPVSTSRHRVEEVSVVGRHRADLEALVARLGDDVVRAKGLIRCDDSSAPVEVQVVGRRRQLRDRPDLTGGGSRLVVVRAP
ncbi:MAG: CobW family GTP-binding protein [Ilumatobacteraceae bacterium]